MMNGGGKPPKARCMRSTCVVQARCLGGDWEVHGRYMRDQSQIKGREPGAIPRFRGTVYRLLPFAVVVSDRNQVLGRGLGGTWAVHARSKPDQRQGTRCYPPLSRDSVPPPAFCSRGFGGVAEGVRPFGTSSAVRGAVRLARARLPVGLPRYKAGRGQHSGPLDLVRLSNKTTTRSRQASPNHEAQPGAFVPEDAGLGVKPTGSPTGGCAWAKSLGTAQVDRK